MTGTCRATGAVQSPSWGGPHEAAPHEASPHEATCHLLIAAFRLVMKGPREAGSSRGDLFRRAKGRDIIRGPPQELHPGPQADGPWYPGSHWADSSPRARGAHVPPVRNEMTRGPSNCRAQGATRSGLYSPMTPRGVLGRALPGCASGGRGDRWRGWRRASRGGCARRGHGRRPWHAPPREASEVSSSEPRGSDSSSCSGVKLKKRRWAPTDV